MTLHLLIRGKVQGVFYRATTRDVAEKLGIKGWVKNTSEGNVEIVCEGQDDAISQFVDWCKKGPPAAKVESVDVDVREPQQFSDFSVIRGKS